MLLFTPGPTPVPEELRWAMAAPTIHHRTPEFESIFASTKASLLALLGMQEVLMLASSGTGAMEACMATFCNNTALVINSGKFGERFAKIATALGRSVHEIKHEWDTPANANEILEALGKNPNIDAIFLQACESAGGLRHPFEEIASKIKEYNPEIFVVVDCITALGVEFIDTHNIDAVIGGSQKAFMLPPGLSIIGLSEMAVRRIEQCNVGYYFNLANELKNQRKNTTAYTPATTLIIGLAEYFQKVLIDGFYHVYHTNKARALGIQKAMQVLELQIYPKVPAIAMTTIAHEQADTLRKTLKSDFAVNLAGGQDNLKGKIFRINQMGLLPVHECAWVVNAIELALEKLKLRKFDGSANTAFLQTYYAEINKQGHNNQPSSST
mgnify:CR=1 FL=1